MEVKQQTLPKVSNQVAIKLGYKNQNDVSFVELSGTRDDLIDVLLTGLFVFAIGAIIAAIIRG